MKRTAAPVVPALGVTQIIGYGTIYYSFPILAPAIAQDYDVGQPFLFGLLSFGLLLGGLAAPTFGRSLDRFGAARVMTLGSLVVSGLMFALAAAPGLAAFSVLTVLIEVVSFAVLYDAAFATLAEKRPSDTRRAITRLTLIAGFASTIFWPLTGWLVNMVGWRGVQVFFALLNLMLAAPLHLWIAGSPRHEAIALTADGAPAVARFTPLPDTEATSAFLLLAISFALTGMAIAALGVHLVPVLLALNLGSTAYLAAMVMGPAQVIIRVVDATAWRRCHPLAVALIAAVALPVALAFLLIPGPAQIMAFAFAVCFGVGGGLSSIVRGTVPVALFGTSGLGHRLGRLAAIRSVLGAASPFLFSWASALVSMRFAVAAASALALLGVAALVLLQRRLSRMGLVPPLGRF